MYNPYNKALVASENEIKCWICYKDKLSKQCAKEKEPVTKAQAFCMTVFTWNESGLVVDCVNVCISLSLYVMQIEDGNDS